VWGNPNKEKKRLLWKAMSHKGLSLPKVMMKCDLKTSGINYAIVAYLPRKSAA
jgi:hypothetical protein